ncbi:MAG: hypothetical protein ACI8QS_000023 [Planctomycetota bacterium]|jgi:hypothetical protein
MLSIENLTEEEVILSRAFDVADLSTAAPQGPWLVRDSPDTEDWRIRTAGTNRSKAAAGLYSGVEYLNTPAVVCK